MPSYARLLTLLFVFVCVAPSLSAQPQDTSPEIAEPLKGEALVAALRRGGLVVYFRHATTEKDYADQVTANPNDGSTQRVLSEAGWHQAKAIGQAWRRLGLPVGDVVSSQYFRAWQTADLAFGRYRKDPALNFEPAEDYTDEQFDAMRQRVQPMLYTTVYPGQNRVIVGHDDPFEASTGIYPEPQGVAYVIRPLGQEGGPGTGFELIARLESGDWAELPGN
ncbi:MAG: histidine phosphatase family protein [Planctomycetota bacterium]